MALTCRGMSTSRHRATSRVTAGTVIASHSGGHRHHPRRTSTSGADRTSTARTFARAHSTSWTVTYLGETRCQAIPGGSIASVRILAFPGGLAAGGAALLPVGTGGVAVLRGNPAEPLNEESHHDHHQAAAGHGKGKPSDSLVAAQAPDPQLVKEDAHVPAQQHRSRVRTRLRQDQGP